MLLQEWMQIKGVDLDIFAVLEKVYNKGYRDGERKRNRVLNEEEQDRVADDLIRRVLENEIND